MQGKGCCPPVHAYIYKKTISFFLNNCIHKISETRINAGAFLLFHVCMHIKTKIFSCFIYIHARRLFRARAFLFGEHRKGKTTCSNLAGSTFTPKQNPPFESTRTEKPLPAIFSPCPICLYLSPKKPPSKRPFFVLRFPRPLRSCSIFEQLKKPPAAFLRKLNPYGLEKHNAAQKGNQQAAREKPRIRNIFFGLPPIRTGRKFFALDFFKKSI